MSGKFAKLTTLMWSNRGRPDPVQRNLLWHEKPRQHPGRREHVHGPVHAMNCKCGGCNG